jgi:hypothetical protein
MRLLEKLRMLRWGCTSSSSSASNLDVRAMPDLDAAVSNFDLTFRAARGLQQKP